MPRNSLPKYVLAFDVIDDASDYLGISRVEISNVLIEAINANRIRMMGRMVPYGEVSASGAVVTSDLLRSTKIASVRRDLLNIKLSVKPVWFGDVVKMPFLCDRSSNIHLGPIGKKARTFIIGGARLLKSDSDRVLSKRFDYPKDGSLSGVSRSDRTWGEVILRIIDLQRRGALDRVVSSDLLLKTLLEMVPDANESTVRPVLGYVSARIRGA